MMFTEGSPSKSTSLLDIYETSPGLNCQSWPTNFNEKTKSHVLGRELEMKHSNSAAAYQRLNSTLGTSDGKNEYKYSDIILTSSFATSTKMPNPPSAISFDDNRSFLNRGAEKTENKLCIKEPDSPIAHFEDDSDTQDEAVIKSEEFEDDSEIYYQGVDYCNLKCRSFSVDELENSNDISNSNNTIVSTVQSLSKEMNTLQSPCKDAKKFQSSLEDINRFQSPSKEVMNTRTQRLSLGRIPNNLKCFCCQRIVKEDHFSEHLFFGAVKCTRCNSYFRNCQIFTAWSAEHAIKYRLCDHKYVFVNDPLVYITESLILVEAENSLGYEEFSSALEKYISKLQSLESKLPWKYAICKCKDHIALKKLQNIPTFKNSQSDLGVSRNVNEYKETEYLEGYSETNSRALSPKSTGAEEVEDQGKDDYFTLIEKNMFSEMTSKGNLNNSRCFMDEEHSQNSGELSTLQTAEVTSSALPHGIYNEDTHNQLLHNAPFSCTNGTNKELDLEDSLPNQIGLKTGSSEISTPTVVDCDRAKYHFKNKVCSKKRQKKRQKGTNKKICLKITTEMVNQPSDGFYLITQSPIEECPNCYCKLCPSRSTVNCKTFLITFICPDCDLVIYIANDDTVILTKDSGNTMG